MMLCLQDDFERVKDLLEKGVPANGLLGLVCVLIEILK